MSFHSEKTMGGIFSCMERKFWVQEKCNQLPF